MLEMNRLIVSAVAAALETASVAAPESARPALVPAPQKVEWKTGACPAGMPADHKLNVLHWHLTDNQGWRILLATNGVAPSLIPSFGYSFVV